MSITSSSFEDKGKNAIKKEQCIQVIFVGIFRTINLSMDVFALLWNYEIVAQLLFPQFPSQAWTVPLTYVACITW